MSRISSRERATNSGRCPGSVDHEASPDEVSAGEAGCPACGRIIKIVRGPGTGVRRLASHRPAVLTPRPKPMMKNLTIRLSNDDRARFEAMATTDGLSLSDWIRLQCVSAAGGTAKVVRVEFVSHYTTQNNAYDTGVAKRDDDGR